MENWKLLLAGIRNALKETFNIKGSVEVSNLPDVQRVEITNPQEPTETVVVSNLVDYKEDLNKIIGELIKVPKDIKTADYSPIIKALQDVVKTLEADKTDYSPIILAIESAVKELKVTYPEFDDSQIVKAIKEIQIPQLDLDRYLYNGEVPVILNTEQLKKLVKAFGKQVGSTVVSMGSGAISGFALESGGNLADIKTAIQILDNIVSGSEAQVDIVAALPAGTNAIGKLLPPDIDVTTHTNYARKYYTSTGAATDGIVWSPAAGKRWHIVSMYLQTSADATVTLEDDKAAGDDPVWKSELKAGSGAFLTFPDKYPLASGEDAADLLVTTSAGNIYITIVGYEI